MILLNGAAMKFECPLRGEGKRCSGAHCACWRWSSSSPVRKYQRFVDILARTCNDECDLYAATYRKEEPDRPEWLSADWVWEPGDETADKSARWAESEESWKARRSNRPGYCGLAGSPEFEDAESD
jgi:hypothetical protein